MGWNVCYIEYTISCSVVVVGLLIERCPCVK